MKKVKLFEGFLEEKQSGPACSSSLCTSIMPGLVNVGDLVSHYTPESPATDLVKIQSEVNKIQKAITQAIRDLATAGSTEELDWERAPKAPVFVLNLKNRYPHKEADYHRLWYKAAERQPVFSYGGAIAIFKTYAKREDLLLEDHDYDNELTEEQINNL